LAPKSDCAVGAIGDVTAAGDVTTTAGNFGVTVAMVAKSDAVSAAAGTGWLFNTVRKSAAGAGLQVLAGMSDLRRIAGGVYVGRDAILNVGMT
jgi:hypothetical protein